MPTLTPESEPLVISDATCRQMKEEEPAPITGIATKRIEMSDGKLIIDGVEISLDANRANIEFKDGTICINAKLNDSYRAPRRLQK